MSYAFPLNDMRKGEIVRICIVSTEGTEPSSETERELRAYAEENISRYALPAQYVFIRDSLAKIGKIEGNVLKAESDRNIRKGE